MYKFNFDRTTVLLGIYFLVLMTFGLLVFHFWLVVIGGWAALVIASRLLNLHADLPPRLQKLILYTAIIYPLVETIIKLTIDLGGDQPWTIWLNRVEHFGFSLFIGFILLPYLYKPMQKISWPYQALLWIGAIVILGNFNEFVEYYIRTAFGMQELFSKYYPDTIHDLIVNILGASAGYWSYLLSIRRTKFH